MASALEKSISADITENVLQCPICQCQFMKPKVLSCQHSFCAKCLKGWLQTRSKNTNKVKCAVCRKATVLPPHGVDALPENYAIKGLISLLKDRSGKTAKVVAGKQAEVATKKTPTKSVSKTARKTTPKSGKGKASTAPAKAAGKASEPKAKAGLGMTNKDKNANISRHGKKIPNKPTAKKQVTPMESSSSDESLSDSEDSDDYSDDDDDLSCSDDDSELTVSGSDESEDSSSSGEESDVPPTPTLKNYGEIKVGMEVYVFNHRGKRFAGRVKLLETCVMKPPWQPRTYAGIELGRENTSLITADLDDIESSYLSYWLGENENPCTVVRADDCMPAALVDQLLDS